MGLILNKVNKPFSNTSIYVPLSYNELKISDPFSSVYSYMVTSMGLTMFLDHAQYVLDCSESLFSV